MPKLLFLLATLLASNSACSQDDPAIRKKAEPCFACHGPNGNSQNPAYQRSKLLEVGTIESYPALVT